MKKKGKPWHFFVTALLILVFAYTAFFGISSTYGDITTTYVKGAADIRFGIDIRGGVEATFSPADGVEATTEQLEAAKEIIETRMVSQSITDYEIYTDPTNNRIIVRFPWRSDEQDYDPEAAIDELAATAQLTFRQGMEYETSEYAEDGSIVYRTPSGTTAENIILEGSDVVTAEPRMTQDETTGEYQYVVALTLSDEGAQKFAQATTAMVGETISIWMDDVMLSAPTVNEAITTGECVITGDFTSEEATQLAARIQAGALPFALQVSSFSSMPPTLGAQALDAMLLAGIIAAALYPLDGYMALFNTVDNYKVTMYLNRISPYYLYGEAVTTILNPGVRSIGLVTTSQLEGAVAGYLPFGQSLLLVWPHLVAMLALTLAAFTISYLKFMNQEIRAN